ncbi:MAG: KamA family radical SAM protein, partial [Oscillospiraceae bacterium]|nr:KamA family radical SAM protein [Oscillospiraceae bacterium]
PTVEELDRELDYIRAHAEIRDVLVSGGDPLTLPTDRLETIISRLRAIPHVEIIRIGTRVPCVLPMRIDDELLGMLKKYQPLWINVQFNHDRELTPEAEAALNKMADAGIPLGNQSVLLRGINDDADTMRKLVLHLVRCRVRPYYLYQCDLTEGIAHFRTRVETGVDIIHKLQGNISGFAVPKFVIDAPGGGGKVPIGYGYVRELCRTFYGIPDTRCIRAEGLDVAGADVPAILAAAEREIDALAAELSGRPGGPEFL